jgi:hypothetical protein
MRCGGLNFRKHDYEYFANLQAEPVRAFDEGFDDRFYLPWFKLTLILPPTAYCRWGRWGFFGIVWIGLALIAATHPSLSDPGRPSRLRLPTSSSKGYWHAGSAVRASLDVHGGNGRVR